jgi:hypothetical protein
MLGQTMVETIKDDDKSKPELPQSNLMFNNTFCSLSRRGISTFHLARYERKQEHTMIDQCPLHYATGAAV